MTGFLVGLFVGSPLGFLLCAMFATGKREPQQSAKVLPFPRHPRRAA